MAEVTKKNGVEDGATAGTRRRGRTRAPYIQRLSDFDARVQNRFVRGTFLVTHTVTMVGMWVLYIGGYALSFWLAVRWFGYVWIDLVTYEGARDFEGLFHPLLRSMEFLLLVPLPALVATVVFRNLVSFSDPDVETREAGEREMAVAKRFLIGIIVTVTGTTMLDEFLQGHTEWQIYAGGALIIVSAAVYAFTTRH